MILTFMYRWKHLEVKAKMLQISLNALWFIWNDKPKSILGIEQIHFVAKKLNRKTTKIHVSLIYSWASVPCDFPQRFKMEVIPNCTSTYAFLNDKALSVKNKQKSINEALASR